MGSVVHTWSSIPRFHSLASHVSVAKIFTVSANPNRGREGRPPVGHSHSPDWQWVGHLLGMPAAVCRSHGTLLRT